MTNQEFNLNAQAAGISVQELGLKDMSEEALFAALLQSGDSWTDEQRTGVEAAYNMARLIHADDTYKDRPYVYHLLRVANRLTGYMHIDDPELVIAALLHDSVEDHASELIRVTDPNAIVPDDPWELQRLAIKQLSRLFSPRIASMVASVTNAPGPPKGEETYDEWLERYARKVEQAASTPEGFLIKFADWCDNGLGIVHSEEPEDSPKRAGFKRKYALALPVFERRFQDADVVSLLDAKAQAYVKSQLALGRERLTAQ